MCGQKKVTWIWNLNYKLNLKKSDGSQEYSSLIMKKMKKRWCVVDRIHVLFARLFPSSVSPTTPIAMFPGRHLPPCFSSLLLETPCLASKRVLERIHQPDQYPLENASSALLPSVLLAIMSNREGGHDRLWCELQDLFSKYAAKPY